MIKEFSKRINGKGKGKEFIVSRTHLSDMPLQVHIGHILTFNNEPIAYYYVSIILLRMCTYARKNVFLDWWLDHRLVKERKEMEGARGF